MKRFIALALAAGLIGSMVGALPAEAKKKKNKRCFAGCVIPPKPCADYVPGEQGAGAETTVVTDAATEESPLELEVTAEPGLALTDPNDPTSGHSFYNLQVDTLGPNTGLYVRLEFNNTPPLRDYDLWLNHADGTNASNAHGFNPDAGGPFSPQSDGGHSETAAEQIDGTATNDCQGYTLDLATSIGEGGAMTLKLWLGEIQYAPGP